ncbi:hypothetical protein CEXT_125991 [Caerostris extrusa]|uniref:Uncharacterized protein n=1 Tax=Caerostris extrusa TaxID=172846 RepID=A0AAV4VE90_CAEEX|nr:hypothetical protein CEXT_125991 [Caerostris extrusa]
MTVRRKVDRLQSVADTLATLLLLLTCRTEGHVLINAFKEDNDSGLDIFEIKWNSPPVCNHGTCKLSAQTIYRTTLSDPLRSASETQKKLKKKRSTDIHRLVIQCGTEDGRDRKVSVPFDVLSHSGIRMPTVLFYPNLFPIRYPSVTWCHVQRASLVSFSSATSF